MVSKLIFPYSRKTMQSLLYKGASYILLHSFVINLFLSLSVSMCQYHLRRYDVRRRRNCHNSSAHKHSFLFSSLNFTLFNFMHSFIHAFIHSWEYIIDPFCLSTDVIICYRKELLCLTCNVHNSSKYYIAFLVHI